MRRIINNLYYFGKWPVVEGHFQYFKIIPWVYSLFSLAILCVFSISNISFLFVVSILLW